MGSEKSQPPSTGESSQSADDFQRIQGIGPVIERQLYNAGILTYARLAALNPEQIGQLIKNLPLLSVERIARQDWPGQARALAADSALLDTGDQATTSGPYSRYATFTVELLLDDTDQVRRTRIMHVQDGEEEIWSGWDENDLIRFVAAHAAIEDSLSAADVTPTVASGFQGMSDCDIAPPNQGVSSAEFVGPALPIDWPTDRAPGDVRLEIGELTVEEAEPDQHSSEQLATPLIRAQVEFRLNGPGAAKVVAQAAWSTVQIVAYNLVSGESTVLGVGHSQFIHSQLDYAPVLNFPLPADGRYQLIGVVLVAEAQLVGSALGPILRVVP